jgi:hypothetical protein
MINRLLYGLVAAAMASVLVIDGTFSANLFHAIGEPTADLSLNGWDLWGIAIFLALAVAALYRELRR